MEGAIRFLQSRPEADGLLIGVIGFSMGGAVALLTAARLADIRAVVSDSAFATLGEAVATGFCSFFRIPRRPFAGFILWLGEKTLGARVDKVRPLDAITELSPRPVLLIHGTRDRVVPLSEAYLLYEAAGDGKELWTVAGAGHVEARFIAFDSYLERVDSFLKQHLAVAGEAVQL